MILPDVNVLIYAFRPDSVDHLRYKSWLEDIVNGPFTYGMSPHVLSSVVRICTHPRIFKQPSGLAETLEFCRAVMAPAQATVVVPGERHWSLFERICIEANAVGSLVPDAWNAALAMEAGCEWITTDRDYARFTGLKWSLPF